MHNAEHHKNCTQRRKSHKKLKKNKEMAVIIKNYNIIYGIESNKVFKLIRSYGLDSQIYVKNKKPH